MQFKSYVLAVSLLTLTAGTAMAQDATMGGLKDACKAEFADVCKDSADKGGMKCLSENQDKLSTGCATAVAAAKERRKAFRAACMPDADKLCSGLKGHEMMGCLKGKTTDLSKPCADALAAMPGPVAQ